MTCLLDTHFLVWILTRSKRLDAFPWLEGYRPWGVSPVTLLEIQFLSEIGRVDARNPALTQTLKKDPRFTVDEVSLLPLVERALPLDWTRDPFDRLLAAHSLVRRTPLCTVDRVLVEKHLHIVPELQG
jgi:PIN domain nuclease of toxin-antitoxin system